MRSNAKAFIVLGLGIICLAIALSPEELARFIDMVIDFTESAKAGIPIP